MSDIVIVGAGPAGIRAAQTLVAAGLSPLVIDENNRAGGQIYRQPPRGFVRDKRTLYGFEASRAASVHEAFESLLPSIRYLPDTLVWHASGQTLDLLVGKNGWSATVGHEQATQAAALPFDAEKSRAALQTSHFSHILLCTGAVDRTLPFPGWTLPGVYTLGAAQVALKAQGCAIGSNVVLAGAGPLLYLVAYQYARAGAKVSAVLDIGAFSDRVKAVPDMLSLPSVLAKGVYYLGWLKTHGVPVHDNVTDIMAVGRERIEEVRWRNAKGQAQTLPCDALATGFGLRSETQLADLLGCTFDFDTLNHQWLPRRDRAGRSTVQGVYLAGDGSGIAGADAAELGGRRAALALLEDMGRTVDAEEVHRIETASARIGKFRRGLERAFAPPMHWARKAADETIVCRCEEVSAGALRESVHVGGVKEMNRMKALCRVGMGRCQGRICSSAAAEILSQETGLPIEQVGRWRSQPPIKPIPVAAALATLAAKQEETAP